MKKSELREIIREMIRKVDGKYVVYPKHGGDRLGTHNTKAAAEKQLAAIHINKEVIEPADEDTANMLQLATGIGVELEHTDDREEAKKIALQHLAEDPHYYSKLLKIGLEEQEETIDFNVQDINGTKVVLATYGKDKVGALRLKPYMQSYQVDSVIVKPEYRGYGIGKEMYRLAHEKLGPLYSDAHQTADASALWQSLIKSGEAKKDKDRFVMTEGPHDPMNPGILKKRLGSLSCTKVRTARGKLKDKGTTYAKALQRYLNYHC